VHNNFLCFTREKKIKEEEENTVSSQFDMIDASSETKTNTNRKQAVCHCLTCQKLTGSTNTHNIAVPHANFHMVTPEADLKTFTTTHETGMQITISFCAECGITLFKRGDSEEFKGTVLIQAGTLDKAEGGAYGRDAAAKPDVEFYVKYRAPWLAEVASTGQKAEF
jgi:hypothetical protein